MIDARNARRNSAVQAVEQLQRAQANVLGIVLNRAPGPPKDSYYRHAPARVEQKGAEHSNGDAGGGDSKPTARLGEWLRRSRV